jgi:transcriptional regulator with XRE-family HTH domain
MDEWEEFEQQLLEDPETKAAYDALMEKRQFAHAILELRSAMGLTQRELAAKAGLHQPEIARIESGRSTPTWATVSRIFSSVGATVEVRVKDQDGKVIRLALNTSAPANEVRGGRAVPR